jgi:hypothetical protein
MPPRRFPPPWSVDELEAGLLSFPCSSAIVLIVGWFTELRRRPREEAVNDFLALLLLYLIPVAIALVWGVFHRPTG